MDAGFDLGKHGLRQLFDLLDLFLRQRILDQQIKHRQLFIRIEAFAHITLLLGVHFVDKLHKVLKDDGDGVFLIILVVLVHNLLIPLIIVRAERIVCHHLIEAFKSTLEEAKYADYIIHVVDSSNPQAEMQMHVVYETLRELGVMGKKIITLFNKQDVPGACVLRDFKSDYSLKISARTGQGLEELGELLARLLAEDQIYMERIFPYQEAGKIQLIREYGQLLSEEYTETGILVKARVPREIYGKVV